VAGPESADVARGASSVFITGAARGLGAAIARRFRASGSTVIAPSRAELDLSDPASVQRFLEHGDLGPVDVLINNAGENVLGTIAALPEADLRRMFEVNVLSVWSLTRAFGEMMRRRKRGRIVNLASVYGFKSRVSRGAYTSTKAAIIGFTKAAAIEFGADNILVNAVAPGFIDTDLTRKNNSPEQIERLCEMVPLGRLGEPDEIANLVYWLGSEENTYMTGQTLVIDGGFLIQ
jgi:3-oxoacyl-[acyl-carrier protein] reductase